MTDEKGTLEPDVPSGEFEGRVAVVTGGASGIGRAVARALVSRGARVAVLDVKAAAADEPERLSHHLVDVASAAQVEAAVEAVEHTLGAIDYGVSVAGILSTDAVLDTSDETWNRVLAVNATGVFNVFRAVARRMAPRRRGALVAVTSNTAGVPRQRMAAYAASKAAATMFTRCLGLEVAPLGIRCNIVAPGSTRTAMQTALWSAGTGEQDVIAGAPEAFRTGIPLGRIGEPEDVAEAVLFLLSDRAKQITMADLYVDGGATLRG